MGCVQDKCSRNKSESHGVQRARQISKLNTRSVSVSHGNKESKKNSNGSSHQHLHNIDLLDALKNDIDEDKLSEPASPEQSSGKYERKKFSQIKDRVMKDRQKRRSQQLQRYKESQINEIQVNECIENNNIAEVVILQSQDQQNVRQKSKTICACGNRISNESQNEDEEIRQIPKDQEKKQKQQNNQYYKMPDSEILKLYYKYINGEIENLIISNISQDFLSFEGKLNFKETGIFRQRQLKLQNKIQYD